MTDPLEQLRDARAHRDEAKAIADRTFAEAIEQTLANGATLAEVASELGISRVHLWRLRSPNNEGRSGVTTTTRPKARPGAYAKAVAKWMLGSGGTPPGGFSYGLDQTEAHAIEAALREVMVASGGAPPPEWKPSTRHHRDRLKDAYTSRGLAYDPSAYPDSIYDAKGRLKG
jgi:hypothetical protein